MHDLTLDALTLDATLYFEDERWMEPGKFKLTARSEGRNEIVELIRMLDEGEGPKIEFKPYVNLSAKKYHEIVETILAFANTVGGTILLGIDDQGEVVGIEQAIFQDKALEGKQLSCRITEYFRVVRKRVTDLINRPVKFDCSVVEIADGSVLRIDVQQGINPPYYFLDGKKVFVRKGATNRLADPDVDLSAMFREGNKLKYLEDAE